MIESFELNNGIRVLHKWADNHIAHCGIFINTGSRDEEPAENGMAHFIEHVIFKGTEKRKAYHILNRLESVGGDLNAFTAKETTCIYASFLNEFYDRTLELISDIIFHSVFPVKELEKEKDVIIDEINSYKDTPSEYIFDEFEELIFNGHSLGRNILGKPDVLKKFRREDVLRFIDKNYFTDQMVICSVGKMEMKKLRSLVEKYYGCIRSKHRARDRVPFSGYEPAKKTEEKKIFQTHCLIGNEAYARSHDKRMTLVLLNNILGGPGLNSRLNLMIREKYGFTYHIESSYQPYSDTGIWSVYLGTTNGSANRTIQLVMKELKKLREQKLGSLQLKRAKTQFKGQIAIHFESNLNKMLSMGKSFLMDHKVDNLDEINRKVEEVTAEDILMVANEIFHPDQLSTLIYKSE
ncbi:MAG: insulinase family protein [Bacteroidetes bacterium]|nr:insulinase family protein [Bacteroidota bacterium]